MMVLSMKKGVQWLSGRVLDSTTEGPQVRASPASLCFVFEQDTLILASGLEIS